MKLFSFLRNHEPQGFGYKPRFYDPDKYDLELRIAEAQGKNDGGLEAMKTRITHGLKRGRADNHEYKKGLKKKSNMRLATIFFALLLLTVIMALAYFPLLLDAVK